MLRRLAERAARNVRFRARLPKRFGRRPIWLSPGNHLAVLKPGDRKFEAYLLGFVDRFVGSDDVVWDIGANMGMFAIPAAHRAKLTVAFEPDPFNLELLHKSLKDNPDLNLNVLPVALTDEIAVARLAIPERGRSANSLVGYNYGSQMGGVRQEYSVMTVPADWVAERFGAPSFIKCDAEGAEAMILRGATAVLKARPVVIIEMPNANADECAAIFKANDYAMLSSYEPVDPAKAVEDIHDVWDVLAIPREKLAGLTGR